MCYSVVNRFKVCIKECIEFWGIYFVNIFGKVVVDVFYKLFMGLNQVFVGII